MAQTPWRRRASSSVSEGLQREAPQQAPSTPSTPAHRVAAEDSEAAARFLLLDPDVAPEHGERIRWWREQRRGNTSSVSVSK